jgi:hypothetical protein
MADSPLSIADNDQNNATVKVFPTISNGLVNIVCNTKYEVEVYNSTGKLVSKHGNMMGSTQIDVSSQLSSFFIFKIKTEQNSHSYKVVKQDW